MLPGGAGSDVKLRRVADEFAASGYLVIAPALSSPIAAIEGADADTEPQDPAVPLFGEIQLVVDSVRDCGKIAVLGYGPGGGLAYVAANRISGLACAVSYYGTGIVDAAGAKRRIPTLLHFGEADAVVPFTEVSQFRAYHPEVSAFSYRGAAHDFDADGQESYDKAATTLAFERTMSWISQYVVGPPPVTLKNAGAYALAKTDKKKKKKSDDDMGPPTD
jgi:carboxymethylenebutenolidase